MNAQKVVKLPTSEKKPTPLRSRPLKTMEQVRQELSKVYRASRNNLLDIGDASKLANILALVGRVIEGSSVESRIKALEDQRNG